MLPLFQPIEFWTVAQQLAGGSPEEGCYRAAISRAYYAMLLIARDWLNVPSEPGLHGGVLEELRRKQHYPIEARLRTLKVLRELADYDRYPTDHAHRDWSANWAQASSVAEELTEHYKKRNVIMADGRTAMF
jgi:uncharacterized protein (UPF0332 family)